MQWLYGRKALYVHVLTGVNVSHAMGSPVKLDRSHCIALIRVPSLRSIAFVGGYLYAVCTVCSPLKAKAYSFALVSRPVSVDR